jgi:hypothetical protein
MLRKREVKNSDFGRWRKRLSSETPNLSTYSLHEPRPKDLRGWLVQRWKSAYDEEFGNSWTVYILAVARNPLRVFGLISDPEILSRLYSISWRAQTRRLRAAPRARR